MSSPNRTEARSHRDETGITPFLGPVNFCLVMAIAAAIETQMASPRLLMERWLCILKLTPDANSREAHDGILPLLGDQFLHILSQIFMHSCKRRWLKGSVGGIPLSKELLSWSFWEDPPTFADPKWQTLRRRTICRRSLRTTLASNG